MFAGLVLGLVHLLRHSLVQDLVDQRGFAAAGHAGDAGERPQGDVDVDVLQIVGRGAFDRDLFAAARPPGLWHLDLPRAGQILTGDGFLTGFDVFQGPLHHEIAACHARAGTDVDDLVRALHGLLVVLDDDQSVAQVGQAAQGVQQLAVVLLVQADGGFVQDVHDPHERRSDLGRQADALRFAAGQGRGGSCQGQIVKAYFDEETQPRADLLEDEARDGHLLFAELLR